MSSTLENMVLASAAIALGAIVESILGFGCNLVWMALFPLFCPVQESVGVHQPLGLALNILILARCYKHAKLEELKPLILTTPLGICFGIWVVTSWPVRWINASLGSFLLIYTFLDNTKNKSTKKDDDEVDEEISLGIINTTEETSTTTKKMYLFKQSSTSIVAGFVGGALTSAFGTGGPAMLVYAKHNKWDARPDVFRANIQLIFFYMHSLAIFSMVLEGVVTAETAKASLFLVPSVIVGGLIGTKVAVMIPKDAFAMLVINGLRIMGVVFLREALH
mmetsp:Transcript_16864/g.24752  ORF Transcript_16864/g.24752 Transcript_16864/m.24752 type:complete len:278 (+) Transcript_16864:113-946(+)|eukprot:CAMPEP_0194085722 /NCGR_PEP_ID=MMETSP0149-20130528/18505_1 /TAXON_ID=122233 /ORGANISM="Chaetoceros debilis, Strain MM31A-1" /LENGTH=277 /DNA_ID=CAMNT_0038768667 /DNA_START=48 /DNA_END=881 /DNA_ORIENTATION=+